VDECVIENGNDKDISVIGSLIEVVNMPHVHEIKHTVGKYYSFPLCLELLNDWHKFFECFDFFAHSVRMHSYPFLELKIVNETRLIR